MTCNPLPRVGVGDDCVCCRVKWRPAATSISAPRQSAAQAIFTFVKSDRNLFFEHITILLKFVYEHICRAVGSFTFTKSEPKEEKYHIFVNFDLI